MRMRFPQYWVVRAHEPASFWWENFIAVLIHAISTTSFSENVIVAEASYKMLEVLSFCDQERA